MKKIVYFFLSLVCLTPVFAKEIFPEGCVPQAIQNETVRLSAEKPTVIMIHNLSSHDIWITHPELTTGAGAGWSTHLQPGHWSALALRSKKFELTCIESMPGHEQQIACVSALAICQWPNAKLPKKLPGTFWAGENMSLSELKAYIERRGFVLTQK